MTSKQKILLNPKVDLIGPVDATHSVEYFHIYTDESISSRHLKSLEYLREMNAVWGIRYKRIILIDNYNPKEHKLSVEEILKFLDDQKLAPDFWGLEADMIEGADLLLKELNNNKLRRSYISYIDNHGKYPCSLLTAVWYLKRLGYLKNNGTIKSYNTSEPYIAAKYLLNILPSDYSPTELRAFSLIKHSSYSKAVSCIQDIFYPAKYGKPRDFF